MCVVLADPGRERWASTDEPTQEELKDIHDHFIAYGGRYEVNEADGLVVHHIEMHVTPNNIGDVATRRVCLEGSRLTLSVLPEELAPGMLDYVLRWRRVATPATAGG